MSVLQTCKNQLKAFYSQTVNNNHQSKNNLFFSLLNQQPQQYGKQIKNNNKIALQT